MRYPKFLQPGGRIGCIAPSFGCATEPYRTCFEAALERFKGMGYTIVTGPNCYAADGTGKSNTPEACGAEINDFFLNDRSDIILSCGGGETMCEDLEYVDFEGIRNAVPKWFMGYSDNTNLTFTLPTLCDTAAVYAPCAPAFGMDPWHPALWDAYSLLTGEKLTMTNYDGWESEGLKDEEHPFVPYNITEPFGMRFAGVEAGGPKSVSAEGEACFSGRLLGGCLDCLVTLCGTKYDRVREFSERYKEDGIIWFLEACDLNPMGIRRALWQLDQAGWFDHAKGFLIGRSLHYGEEMMGMDCLNAVTGILSRCNVPILLDVDLGHLPPMMPLIVGAKAQVEASAGSLRIEMEPV